MNIVALILFRKKEDISSNILNLRVRRYQSVSFHSPRTNKNYV